MRSLASIVSALVAVVALGCSSVVDDAASTGASATSASSASSSNAGSGGGSGLGGDAASTSSFGGGAGGGAASSSSSTSSGGGDACNADTLTDPHNCGACGHDCLGAACAAGLCGSTVVWSGVTAFEVDETDIYAAMDGPYGARRIERMPKDGGDVAELATNLANIWDMALTASRVVWIDMDDAGDGALVLYAMSKSGTDRRELGRRGISDERFAGSVGERVYYEYVSAPRQARLVVASADGRGAPVELGDVGVVSAIVPYDGTLYFVDTDAPGFDGGRLATVTVDGSAPIATILTDERTMDRLALRGGELFVSLRGDDPGIARVDLAALRLDVVVPSPAPADVVADADAVYWLDYPYPTPVPTIRKLDASGAAYVIAEAGEPGFDSLRVDDRYVYWLDGSVIRRAPK